MQRAVTNDSLVQELASLVAQFTRAFRLLEREDEACHGVTVPQLFTILAIREAGAMTMNQLADALAVATSTATRIVDNLVEAGIMERDRAGRDRRVVYVRLSGKGEELSDRLQECVWGYFAGLVALIPPEERRQVLESMEMLVAAARTYARCC